MDVFGVAIATLTIITHLHKNAGEYPSYLHLKVKKY